MSRARPPVHLVDPEGPAGARWLERLSRPLRSPADTVLLGNAVPGVPCHARVPVGPSRSIEAASLRRLLRSMHAQVVVAWGTRCVASLDAAADDPQAVHVLDAVPRVTHPGTGGHVLAACESLMTPLQRAGWPAFRMRPLQLPAVPFARALAAGRREELRRAWHAEPGTTVVALLPAGQGQGDAFQAMEAVGRAALAGADVRLLLHPDTRAAGAMQIFARSFGFRDRVHLVDAMHAPETLAEGLDVCLSIPDPDQDGTALDPAVAAGLGCALVACERSMAAGGAEPGVEALLGDGVNALGSAVLRLHEDAALRRELALALRVRWSTQTRAQAFMAAMADPADVIRLSKVTAASR